MPEALVLGNTPWQAQKKKRPQRNKERGRRKIEQGK